MHKNTTFKTQIIIPLFVLLSTQVIAQFNPVRPDNTGLFLCSHYGGTEDPEYLTSEFESVTLTSDAQTFIPKKSLTSLLNSYSATNTSWLGDSIIFDFDAQKFNFIYHPVKYDNQFTMEITPKRSFSIPSELNIGTQFTIDPYINAEVISHTNITWNGFPLNALTIRLTHDGTNPEYNWTTGDIVITEAFGIHEFPNLQYFPYQWNKCVLAGLENPQTGVQDLSAKDIYRMGVGDQYTAERFYLPVQRYYQIKKCLSIISEDESHQERVVEIKKYNQSYVDYTWSLKQDTLTENIVYSEQIAAMAAGELRGDNIGKYCRMDHPNDKYIYTVFNIDTAIYTDHIIDACGPIIVFKHGFDDYFNFSYVCETGPWENYYSLYHKIVNGVETGSPLNVDSLLSNKSIVQLADVSIFPNPGSGEFSLELPDNIQMGHYMLTGLTGTSFNLKPISRDSKTIHFKQSLAPGIYILHGIDKTGTHYNLGKITII